METGRERSTIKVISSHHCWWSVVLMWKAVVYISTVCISWGNLTWLVDKDRQQGTHEWVLCDRKLHCRDMAEASLVGRSKGEGLVARCDSC